LNKQIKDKINRLYKIADGLLEGEDYQITRIRTINSLCHSQKAKFSFIMHCIDFKYNSLKNKEATAEDLKAIKNTKNLINNYIKEQSENNFSKLNDYLSTLKSTNDKFRRSKWGDIRIIESSTALFCELAIKATLRSNLDDNSCYYLVKEIVEIYDPSYGTGIVPKSYASVKSIADFWNNYYTKEESFT
jgi:hypothetical protein